jgi:hypothetical protein
VSSRTSRPDNGVFANEEASIYGHLAHFMVSRHIESEATPRQLFHPPGEV